MPQLRALQTLEYREVVYAMFSTLYPMVSEIWLVWFLLMKGERVWLKWTVYAKSHGHQSRKSILGCQIIWSMGVPRELVSRDGKNLDRSKRNILVSTIEQKKVWKIQRPLCEIFTGRREREGTSSPLSSHARSWEADRSRMNYGMLAVGVVSDVLKEAKN